MRSSWWTASKRTRACCRASRANWRLWTKPSRCALVALSLASYVALCLLHGSVMAEPHSRLLLGLSSLAHAVEVLLRLCEVSAVVTRRLMLSVQVGEQSLQRCQERLKELEAEVAKLSAAAQPQAAAASYQKAIVDARCEVLRCMCSAASRSPRARHFNVGGFNPARC